MLKKNWLLALEIAVAVTFFGAMARPMADLGGGTVPIVALVFAAASIALHRVRPALAFASLVLQTATLLAFGFGGRTAPLEMWLGAPLVLFSAALFGRRLTRVLSLVAGAGTCLAFTTQSVGRTMAQHVLDPEHFPFGPLPLPDALLLNAPSVTLSAVALLVPPAVGAALHARSRAKGPVPNPPPTSLTLTDFAKSASLSPREQRVFELAAQGLTNAEIATAEHVTEATVKSQMTRVLAKVGARDRVQLAIDAHRRGLFDPVR